jgi:hypothetical protein
MMAGVSTLCEDCEGRRFQASVLDYRLGTLNIAEVLDRCLRVLPEPPVSGRTNRFEEIERRVPGR